MNPDLPPLLASLTPVPGLGRTWHGTWVGQAFVAEEAGTVSVWNDLRRPPVHRLPMGRTQAMVAAPAGDRLALYVGGSSTDSACDLVLWDLHGAPQVITRKPAARAAGAFRFDDFWGPPLWAPDGAALAVRGNVVDGEQEVRIFDGGGGLLATLATNASPTSWTEHGLCLFGWTPEGYEELIWRPGDAAAQPVDRTVVLPHRSPGGTWEVQATAAGLMVIERASGEWRELPREQLAGAANLHELADRAPVGWIGERLLVWADSDETPAWVLDVYELRQCWLAPFRATFVAADAWGQRVVVKRDGAAVVGTVDQPR